jgi:hypothetical protein
MWYTMQTGALYECPTRVLGSAENCQLEFAATIPPATVPSLTNSKTPHSEEAASKVIVGGWVLSDAPAPRPIAFRTAGFPLETSIVGIITYSHSSLIMSTAAPKSPFKPAPVERPEEGDFAHDLDRDGCARTVSSQSKTTWCSLDIVPAWQCSPPPSAAGKRW